MCREKREEGEGKEVVGGLRGRAGATKRARWWWSEVRRDAAEALSEARAGLRTVPKHRITVPESQH